MNLDFYKDKIGYYKQQHNISEVMALCEQLSTQAQEDWESQIFLGDTFIDIGKWEKAITAYKNSLALKSEFDWAWYNLAVSLGHLGRWDEVTECHQALERLKPEFWRLNAENKLVQKHLSAYRAQLRKETGSLKTGSLNDDEASENTSEAIEDDSQIYKEHHDIIDKLIKLNDTTCLAAVEGNFSSAAEALSIYADSDRLHSASSWYIGDNDKKTLLFFLPNFDINQGNYPEITVIDASVEAPSKNQSKNQSKNKYLYNLSADTKLVEGLDRFASVLSHDHKRCLFNGLSRYQEEHAEPALDLLHHSFLETCYQSAAESSQLVLEHGCWLTPNTVYFEISVENIWILGNFDVAVTSEKFFRVARGYSFQISSNRLAGVAVFSADVYTKPFRQYSFAFLKGKQRIPLSNTIHTKNYNLEFVQYLNDKSDNQRYLIRENICRSIIELSHERCQESSAALISKIQQYVFVASHNPLNPQLPFQLFFDQVIAIGHSGFFLTGWIHDPFQSLERIEVISDLGFSFDLLPDEIYRFERPDLKEHLSNIKYGNYSSRSGKLGFCAYAQTKPELQEKFKSLAALHGVRFSVKLKADISIEIVPEVKFFDAFKSRSLVVKTVAPDQLTEKMLSHCIGPAAAKLQELCMQEICIDEIVEIGDLVESPKVSVIIPIYGRYDFQKVQISLFANDHSLREMSEIIYVLDSPWQKYEFHNFMKQHCKLYNFPVKLVFMEGNSGYSSANNAGALSAKGDYLILMNSDVFPIENGWLPKMLDFYQSSSKIGTVGGKLLYEDDSLQHAGMFFAKTTYPFWQNLHYFKGFPKNYPPAQQARSVPAVTGACLMIETALYSELGGLSTEYVIGDFEDSDLCLRCAERGYENWYYPDIEFYHLERQSIPLNASYSEGLAWHHNARVHNKRWDAVISEMMALHPGS